MMDPSAVADPASTLPSPDSDGPPPLPRATENPKPQASDKPTVTVSIRSGEDGATRGGSGTGDTPTSAHAPISAAKAVKFFKGLQKLMEDGLEDRGRDDGSESGKAATKRPTRKDSLAPTTDKDTGTKAPAAIIPEVRYCNYQQFMNRFPGSDATYAIEVLQTGPQLGKDIFDEWETRCNLGVEGYDEKGDNKPDVPRHGSDSDETWIHRVRIQSPRLLKILQSVTGYSWGTKPHTFLRPFRYMIHFHDKVKDRLASMETTSEMVGAAGSSDELSGTAVEELRCYVQFAEEKIVPLYNAFQEYDFSKPTKIWFHDLWYLFRPGELIYIPGDTLTRQFMGNSSQGHESTESSSGRKSRAAFQTIWKLWYAQPKYGPTTLGGEYAEDSRDEFEIECYYYDQDGSTYAGVSYAESFRISWFQERKDIRDLAFYPLRFAHDWQATLAEGRSWGQKFTEYVERKHLSYSGWTVTHHPIGTPILSPQGNQVRRPEHIEGDIIVDFQEAFNNCPDWKLNFTDEEFRSGRGGYDTYINARDPIITWADPERSTQVSTVNEVFINDDDIDTLEHDMVVEKDQFLRAKTRVSKPKPTGDDLALLPRRLFAYAIRERKFVLVDLQHIKPIKEQADVFEKLELRPEHKRHILALISSHFRSKELDKEGLLSTQDLIRGKGKGVVILLHGAPGVGKTATAEAVAQKFGRPLFPITCGDLGFKPDTVEENLSEIFRLAHLWDCVLLLDEADVFLTARSPRDIKQNALVSVFLRILEYYNGVLFLTTNRVGTLDPAVTSRVHVNLHYRRLQAAEFCKVFELNIERLELIEQQRHDMFKEPKLFILKDEIVQFAMTHYRESGDGRESWNGRQIRNAFLIASSLARYEIEQQPAGFQPQLRASHFKEVETITKEYDSFRKHLKGGDDADVAYRKNERDDTWEEGSSSFASTSRPASQPLQALYQGKTYQSPMGSTHNIHAAYGTAYQRGPSPHSTPPSRPHAPGPMHSAPAHLSAEPTYATYSTTPHRSQESYHHRQYPEQVYGRQPSPTPYRGGPPPEHHRPAMPTMATMSTESEEVMPSDFSRAPPREMPRDY